MTEEDITAKLKLKEYLTTNEQVLTYEKNFYLTHKRLIKFIMKTDIPKIEAFQDMDLNHLVSIQKMYKPASAVCGCLVFQTAIQC